MERWWINGEPARSVDVTDRGLAYGDGLFETVALRRGQPRFLDLHLDRLLDGCRRLGIPGPDRAALAGELTARAAESPHGTLKLILTRGSGPRGYAPPPAPAPRILVGLFPGSPPPVAPGGPAPLRVRICRTPAGRSPALAGLKTLNRLEQVLARAEWQDPAIQEGLMLDETGLVVGGTMSNVFAWLQGQWVTPRLDHAGVAGIMRRVILAAAREAGIAVTERSLPREELAGSREIFLCNALHGIRPVGWLEDRTLAPGAETVRLAALLRQRHGVGEWEN